MSKKRAREESSTNYGEEFNLLSPTQKKILEEISTGKNVFITGGAGVGKSLLVKAIYGYLTASGKTVALTATTGIAAVELGGQTIHSYSGLGIATESIEVVRLNATKPAIKAIWKNVDAVIIDEISMLSTWFFKVLNESMKVACQANKRVSGMNVPPFGGIQMIFVGDFFQLPPVVKEDEDMKEKFVFETALWKLSVEKIFNLTEVFRQSDPKFISLLNNIRVGKPTQAQLLMLKSRENAQLDVEDGILPTFLMSRKVQADKINDEKINEIQEEPHLFEAVFGIQHADVLAGSPENKQIPSISGSEKLINNFVKNCPVKSKLYLKKGTQVILCANYCVKRGLANGSRGVVTSFTSCDNHFPIVKFVGVCTTIKPWTWSTQVKKNKKLSIYFGQIPLILGYAITIHKSQSQSLDKVSLSMDRIFEEGQAYVALSRCRSLEGLTIDGFNEKSIKTSEKVLEFHKNFEFGNTMD